MCNEEIIEALVEGILNPETYGLAPEATPRATLAVHTCLTDPVCSCSTCSTDLESVVCRQTLTRIVEVAVLSSPLVKSEIHGWKHWLSVYRNAVVLAETGSLHTFPVDLSDEGVSPDLDLTAVIILFAMFHDCRRHDEGYDVTHGIYGAEALWSLVGDVLPEATDEIGAAMFACAAHTVVDRPKFDPAWSATIHERKLAAGICLDADRMDLIRLGIMPDPSYLSNGDTTLEAFHNLKSMGAWSL